MSDEPLGVEAREVRLSQSPFISLMNLTVLVGVVGIDVANEAG